MGSKGIFKGPTMSFSATVNETGNSEFKYQLSAIAVRERE